jgi:hypothetical protein
MEISDNYTQLPLDFSVAMLNNIKIKNELNNNNNNNNLVLQQNNQQSSSAFKVVTPRKSDGKLRKWQVCEKICDSEEKKVEIFIQTVGDI